MTQQDFLQKSMALQTKFRIKGKEYHLALDTTRPDRNYSDENFSEWFVTAEDGRVLEVTVWKDKDGSYSNDGEVEAFKNRNDFEDGLLLDIKHIKLKKA